LVKELYEGGKEPGGRLNGEDARQGAWVSAGDLCYKIIILISEMKVSGTEI